jgi:hypothetical protein
VRAGPPIPCHVLPLSSITNSELDLAYLLGPTLPNLSRLTIIATTIFSVPDSLLTDVTLLNAQVCSPHPAALGTAREIRGFAHLQRLSVKVAPSPERWTSRRARTRNALLT